MELTWYGTAALVFREGERAIAFDPFGGLGYGALKRPPQALPYEGALRQVEDILVTHGHFDHIYHLPQLYAGGTARVYCTKTPARTLLRLGFPREQLQVIAPGWTERLGPFTLQVWQGRHCRFDAPLLARTVLSRRFFRHPGHLARLLATHLAFPEGGETLFYQVTCGPLRVQVLGSMALDPTVDYPTGADYLILPLQGRDDQDTYALDLVRRLRPRAVLLDHYDDTFPPCTGPVAVSGFLANVDRELAIPCRALVPGERVVLEKREERN